MAVTQKVTLYNNKFTVPPVINAVQNDTDRLIEACFGDFTLQVGMTGVLSFIRSDRTHYEVSATLDTATNTATAELDQALTQAGVTQAQLKITDSGNVGSTFTFMIKVQPDVAGISVPQDGWSAQEFDQRLTDVENAIDAVEEDVADLQDKEYDYAPIITDTASGVIATFPDGADGVPVKDLSVAVTAVQSGSGDPSPENVRPITGFSTAKVTRTGINVWNEEYLEGYYSSTGEYTSTQGQLCTKNKIPVAPNTTYYAKIGSLPVDTSIGAAFCCYDATENFISRETLRVGTFTIPANTHYISINFGTSYGGTYNNDISINYPSADTDYHKGEVQTVTIDLGSTRYGGVLDVTRGKLRVTHEYVILDGTKVTSVSTSSQGYKYAAFENSVSGAVGNSTDGLCNQYRLVPTTALQGIRVVGTAVYAYDDRMTDLGTAQTIYNGAPIQLVYERATPIEVDVDPEVIKTLDGINNIWADTGDIEVEYCADTKRYIQKLISQLA